MHPRTLGWPGTTAMAMGGSNQSLFLIGVIFVSQGSAAVPLLIAGLVAELDGDPGLARADHDVAEPCGWHRGHLRRGLPSLQSCAREPDRGLLLVGVGADVRADRVPLGVRDSAVVPAGDPGDACGLRDHRRLRRRQPVRRQVGGAAGDPLRPHLSEPCSPFSARARPVWHGQLGPGDELRPDRPFRRHFRDGDERDGRPLPDRVRRACLRGRSLPCRRNERPGPQCSAGDVGERNDGDAVLRGAPGRLARRTRRRARLRWAISRACSARRSRRCSVALRQRRRSGSWSSTCSTARCSRWREPPGRCRSWPRTGCCRVRSAFA